MHGGEKPRTVTDEEQVSDGGQVLQRGRTGEGTKELKAGSNSDATMTSALSVQWAV